MILVLHGFIGLENKRNGLLLVEIEVASLRHEFDFGQGTVESELQLRVRIVPDEEVDAFFLVNHTVAGLNRVFELQRQMLKDHILVEGVALH